MPRPGTLGVPRAALKSEPLHSSWVGSSAEGSRKGKETLSIMLEPFSGETKISHKVTTKENLKCKEIT